MSQHENIAYRTNRDKAIALLRSNPFLLARLASAQLRARFGGLPSGPLRKSFGEVIYEFDYDADWLKDEYSEHFVKSMYYDAYEPLSVAYMQENLRPGDVFFDIGANIGYISAVAAGLVGEEGQVHSFEPVPEYFKAVDKLADLNANHNISANQVALGEKNGHLNIYVHDSMLGANTAVAGLAPEAAPSIEVPMITLDSYIESHRIEKITLMKIDVVGYEFPILRGMRRFLETSSRLPAIICEIIPTTYDVVTESLEQFEAYMTGFGYRITTLTEPDIPFSLKDMQAADKLLFQPDRH